MENIINIQHNKIIFLADIHLGVRSSSEEWQENIKSYFYDWFIPNIKSFIENNNDYCLCVLGDVFDDRKSIDINVNNLAIDIFEDLGKLLDVYIINGNHDLSKRTNKGNTSLRSLENISGITVIKDPTLLEFYNKNKKVSDIIAIPYLGEHIEENKLLMEYSDKTDYAFMHTDISSMLYDNGMTIVGAVDSNIYKGRIFSGHIHKRQETKRVVYVGSPYQLRRSDIGNTKGVYVLDLTKKRNNLIFIENEFSPIFHKIKIDDFMKLGFEDRSLFLNNNYNDIIIEENELRNYKMADIYDIANLTTAKHVQIIVNKTKQETVDNDSTEFKDLSIDHLINDSINQLDVDDVIKKRLIKLSATYLKTAESEI